MITRGSDGRNALPADPAAGVCLHVTALPGPHGIGELGSAAFRFIDALAGMGIGVWQFLPTGPTSYGNSPYQPLSSFAGNELLVDVGELVQDGLLRSTEVGALSGLPADRVDYARVIPVKNALLERAAARFVSHATAPQRADYDAFLDRNLANWLYDYGLFRILKAGHGERAWNEWDAPYVLREKRALRNIENRFATSIEAVRIKQFLFYSQWRRLRSYAAERGVTLFGDMPIYIALDSADAWADREIVLLDERGRPTQVAGVPPDYFSEDGQLWGNPLYDWRRHAEDGFEWWTRRVTRSAEIADIVRIDHFRGFEAYWSVPADAPTAREGEWIKGPGDALFEALERSLGELPIVAEDLGVITPEVDALRERHHIPGMKVLQFDICDPEFDPAAIAANCVCYTGTHDNDTTRGWFEGSPGDRRSREEILRTRDAALRVTGGRPDTIHEDMIRLAFETDARLAVAPAQDFIGLGSEARFNVPGKPGGNWEWRLREQDLTPALRDRIGEIVAAAGRHATR